MKTWVKYGMGVFLGSALIIVLTISAIVFVVYTGVNYEGWPAAITDCEEQLADKLPRQWEAPRLTPEPKRTGPVPLDGGKTLIAECSGKAVKRSDHRRYDITVEYAAYPGGERRLKVIHSSLEPADS